AALLAFVAPSLVMAAPVRRQAAPNPNDVLVLQFAQVLNQLEQQFYQQALAKFQPSDITSAGFTSSNVVLQQLTQLQSDESSHITALQSSLTSLGQTPLTTCQFDFTTVLTDISTTVTVARLVENVGVGAFLGAAHLVSDPTILTAAASIVTVEGRHQTMLNIFNNGAAIPNAFDLPLLPNEVLAIASPFISGCNLGVQANPTLTITNTGAVNVGTQLTFSSSAMTGSTNGMFCQLLAGGMPFSLSLPLSACVVPDTLTGPVAVWITSDNQPLNNNARDRTNSTTVAGPAMMFIDNTGDALAALVRATNQNSTITSTVSPNQASSMLAGATATAAVSGSGVSMTMMPASLVSQIAATMDTSAAIAAATASANSSASAAAGSVSTATAAA
ncbi:ferritin-like domain-containing protein, partial [Vararia minispora EC-137]